MFNGRNHWNIFEQIIARYWGDLFECICFLQIYLYKHGIRLELLYNE